MKGLIFIPDISGFTHFVKNTNAGIGASIIQDLLSVIIYHNHINMDVSEIEGDAILFYKLGPPKPLADLIKTFLQMQNAFAEKFTQYKLAYNLNVDLKLKLIVHYGEIIVYDIHGFKKLYGEAIIEAHRLLKNGNESNDYILVTEDYMHNLEIKSDEVTAHQSTFNGSFILNDLKNIAYHIFPPALKYTQSIV